MVDEVKTIRSPKWILLSCKNAEKISCLIVDILNDCSYRTCRNSVSENVDFIVTDNAEIPKGVSAETIFFDGSVTLSENMIEMFTHKVSSYEYVCRRYGDEYRNIKTYSENHYSADVTCRNVDGREFDIIHGGILGRVRMKKNVYTVQDVLLCTAVLTATGIPLASVIEYFSRE